MSLFLGMLLFWSRRRARLLPRLLSRLRGGPLLMPLIELLFLLLLLFGRTLLHRRCRTHQRMSLLRRRPHLRLRLHFAVCRLPVLRLRVPLLLERPRLRIRHRAHLIIPSARRTEGAEPLLGLRHPLALSRTRRAYGTNQRLLVQVSANLRLP